MTKPVPTLSALAALILAVPALMQGASAQTAQNSTAETINIALTDYAFTPATLDLKSGTAYRLHLTNSGTKDHDFSAPEFFAASQIAPDDKAKIKRGKIAVDKGQEIDIAVTPGAAGSYSLTCTHFMHDMMGMHGTITVQ
jgi:plastocyanin